MPDLNLTQTDLNESLRGLTQVDILMFLPDKNITFSDNAVSSNLNPLSYTTRLQSLVEFSSLPQANIATFENNSWILDGSFISPSKAMGTGGDSYTGYISNELTDDSGNYTTNPIITVQLAAVAKHIEYVSIRFAGGIDTSYPKTFKIRTYNNSNSLIKEHSLNISEQTGLPLLVAEIKDDNVYKLEFEFVGTVCPHRRSRLNKIMFGKAEQVDNHYLSSWKIDDKASLVADSIPTKTFEYSIINYEGDYNIDNPGNKIPINYKDSLVLFTLSMEIDGLWKYTPTKTFNLLDISTSADGLVTFSCGSLLDMLTETYDKDNYTAARSLGNIINQLLASAGVGSDQCILGEFATYKINIPLPENPIRELIQKLAFSCGATLTVDDNNRIIFSKKDIIPKDTTPKFMFNQPEPFNSAGVLMKEPEAEALENTTNIAMYTYNSSIDKDITEVGSINAENQNEMRVTYSAISGSLAFELTDEQKNHVNVLASEVYSQHAIVKVTWDSTITPPVNIKMKARKVTTTKTSPTTANMNTLLLDSSLALTAPTNLKKPISNADPNTFYYTDWYGAKFKYKCQTRNEYLIKAGDIIYFETPFSNGEPIRVGYVLRNSYSDSGDSGEMEVVTLG